MKVIVSGMSKTGTKTMAAALRKLGYKVYDYEEQYFYLSKDLIRIINEGWTIEEIKRIYKDVEAVTDLAGNALWEELLLAYPDAKVVHLERKSEEDWGDSLVAQLDSIRDNVKLRILIFLSSSARRFREYLDVSLRLSMSCRANGFIFYPKVNKQMAMLHYRQHNTRVRQIVPKDQLLLFKLSDGWEPLCKFLGKPVPDESFPHRNKGATITEEVVNTSYVFEPIKKEALTTLCLFICALAVLIFYFLY